MSYFEQEVNKYDIITLTLLKKKHGYTVAAIIDNYLDHIPIVLTYK